MSVSTPSYIRVGFSGKGSDEILTAPLTPVPQSIMVYQTDIANNSGSTAAMGYGYKVLDANYKVGSWDDTGTPEFLDDTADAQDSDADDIALFTTTNNDGFVVSATEKFNLVNIVVSTAAAGSPVYEYTYWNGSAWTSFTPIIEPDLTSTTEQALVFTIPSDWAKGGDTGEGVDADHYAIRVRATTAPSTAPLATTVSAVVLLDLVGSVVDGSNINKTTYVQSDGAKIPPGHSLVPYSSVSDNSNTIYVEYGWK
jgi:hypothetical protein